MQNSNSKAGAEAPQSTNADVPTSSQTIAKPIVVCWAFFHKITFHRWDKELIIKVLDSPFNARGFYKDHPQYYYNGFWVVLNEKCNRILKIKRLH